MSLLPVLFAQECSKLQSLLFTIQLTMQEGWSIYVYIVIIYKKIHLYRKIYVQLYI